MRESGLIVSTVVVLGVCGSVFAGPVTVIFQGQVVSGFQEIAEFGLVNASFTYDPAALAIGTGPGVAVYDLATINGDFVVGPYGFNGPSGGQLVRNDILNNKDQYEPSWHIVGPNLLSGLEPSSIDLFFQGDNTILTDTSLPDFSQMVLFSGIAGRIVFDDQFGVAAGEAWFSMDTIEIQHLDHPVIPLPTGAAMAMVGMGVIGVRRRRS